MPSESNIQSAAQIKASQLGSRMFRNNVAKAWIGQSVMLENGDVLIKNPRRLHAGLCKGSSDLIGWTPILITEDLIGQTLSVFTALEIKTETGRVSPEQKTFINAVNSSGGIGAVVRDPSELDTLLQLQQQI